MSAHYNKVMMRDLKKPLLALIEEVVGACDAVIGKQKLPEEVTQAPEAQRLTDSLKMIGCEALSRLAQSIRQGLTGLANAMAQGWDEEHSIHVAHNVRNLARALAPHIEKLAEGEDEFPILLWPQWEKLLESLDALEQVSPLDLFEAHADFEDIKFERFAPEYLKEVVENALKRLFGARALISEGLEQGHDEKLEKGLEQAQKVFHWISRMHHRRPFQGYWLILRARLSVMRGSLPWVRQNKDQLEDLLSHAYVELERFGGNARSISQRRLLEDIRPLLEHWKEWDLSDPVLAELEKRFGIKHFFNAVERLEEAPSLGNGLGPAPELAQALEKVKTAWAHWSTTNEGMRDLLVAYADLIRLSDQVRPAVKSVFQALQRVIEWCAKNQDKEPDEQVLDEGSSALVSLEEGLGPDVDALDDRLELQARRLRALMVPGRAEYGKLPLLRWSAKRLRRETLGARQKALGQIIQDVEAVEQTVEELTLDEVEAKEISALLRPLLPKLEVSASVAKLLRLPDQGELLCALRSVLERIADRPQLFQSEKERALLSNAVPAVLGTLGHQKAEGDSDEDEYFAVALEILCGKTSTGVRNAPDWESFETDAPVEQDLREVSHEPTNQVQIESSQVSNEVTEPETPSVQNVQEEFENKYDVLEPSMDSTSLPSSAPIAQQDNDAFVNELLSEAGVEDNLDRADPMVAEGFFEETKQHLTSLRDWRQDLLAAPHDPEKWEEVRRCFHTIKGSGRFLYLKGIPQVAEWCEKFVSAHAKAGEAYDEELDRSIAQAAEWFEAVLAQLEEQKSVQVDARPVWQALFGDLPTDSFVSEPQSQDEEVVVSSEEINDKNDTLEDAPLAPLIDQVSEESQLETSAEDEDLGTVSDVVPHPDARSSEEGLTLPLDEEEALSPESELEDQPVAEPTEGVEDLASAEVPASSESDLSISENTHPDDPLSSAAEVEAKTHDAEQSNASLEAQTFVDEDVHDQETATKERGETLEDLPGGEVETSALAEWAQGDPEFRDAILRDLDKRQEELEAAAEDQNVELLQRAAHTLRAVGETLGMRVWRDECSQVEKWLEEGVQIDLSAVVVRWLDVMDAIRAEVNDPESSLQEVSLETVAQPQIEKQHALEPKSEKDPWDDVFEAFDQMMEGGRRLGQALQRLAEEDAKKGD